MALPRRHPSKPELAVVSEPGHDPAERVRAVVEDRPAGMVLEPDDGLPLAGLELALDQHVSDQPPVSGDRVNGEHPGARLLRARPVAIEPPQQLVAAADGKHDRAPSDRIRERCAARREVRGDERLLAVLATADVEEVRVGRRRVAEADVTDVELDAATPRPSRQHREIAAIGVDVQVVRIQVREDHRHATRSQYGRA